MTLALLHAGKQTSGSIFSPLDLPGLVGWWDPSELALANGANVTDLVDQSTKGNDLEDYGAPTFVASGINGLGSIQFTSDKSLWKDACVEISRSHLFVVCKGGTAGKDVWGSNGTGTGDILLQLGTGPAAKCHYWGDAGLFSDTAASVINTGAPYILEHIVDATHVRAKSTPDGVEKSVSITGTRPTALQAITMGSRAGGGGGDSFDGMIGEAILCSGTDLAAGERADAIAYLTGKWLVAPPSFAILMETGDAILSEASDRLRME